ncbi:MAG: spore germination protein GerPE [Candidatus Cohnella colombiensis]|uniref:Spore germination protein GerPE n=1 Tax=Candidatus Cohnella colombiensis TaxID=3121368 RepID=A0AA95EZ55_9BACL|nr:MAG: spore germination protein GerPE [Cohnella sp.]
MNASLRRTTRIHNLVINIVSSSAVTQFGDNEGTTLHSRVLAVQEALANYEADEYRYASYRIFTLPKHRLEPTPNVSFRIVACQPEIEIGFVRILGLSSSSNFRAGTGGPFQATSRILHIRQYQHNHDIS